MLAARLGNKPLDDWLVWEANGYPVDVEVPDYRNFPVQYRADFSGIGMSRVPNFPVSIQAFPAEVRHSMGRMKFRDSVSGAQRLLDGVSDGDGLFHVSLTDSALLIEDAMPLHKCTDVRAIIAPGLVSVVLNTVRERVLDFALELEKLDPKAGEVAGSAPPPAEVQQVVQATIYGEATITGSAPGASFSTKGIEMAGDTYTNSGQVAAMGRGASASGNTFQQVAQGVDLGELAGELRTLAGAMREQAGEDRELAESAGMVEAAAGMASIGDGEQAAGLLAKAGPRALAFGEKVGASVVGGTALHFIKLVIEKYKGE